MQHAGRINECVHFRWNTTDDWCDVVKGREDNVKRNLTVKKQSMQL